MASGTSPLLELKSSMIGHMLPIRDAGSFTSHTFSSPHHNGHKNRHATNNKINTPTPNSWGPMTMTEFDDPATLVIVPPSIRVPLALSNRFAVVEKGVVDPRSWIITID